jgi:hypothetical protein
VAGSAWSRAGGAREAPAAGSAVAPGAPVDRDDAMWLRPSDYLITSAPFVGERRDYLAVAKLLEAPRIAGGPATFVAFNGEKVTTEHYWRTRAAVAADLALGGLAFCLTTGVRATPPRERHAARSNGWMMGYVSDVTRLAAGEVSVADAACDLGAVRVPIAP